MTGALCNVRGILRLGLAAAAVITLGVTLGVLVVPLYDMHLFDGVLNSRSIDTLVFLSVLCVVGLALYAALVIQRGLILAAVGERIMACLTAPVLAAALRGAASGDARPVGRALADLQELRLFFSGGAAAAPFDLACMPLLLGVIFLLHPALGLFALGGALLMLALALGADALARPRVARAQAATDDALAEASALLRDPLLRDGFGMEDAIARRWREVQAGAVRAQAQAARSGEALAGLSRLVRGLLQGGMLAFAALLVLRNEATPGVLVGSNLLLALLLVPLERIVAQWRSVAAARLAWRRLRPLLACEARAASAADTVATVPAGLSVDRVTYRPGIGQPAVVADVSLHVPPGALVVVIGPNGAGKSTLARLAAGVLTPTEGAVTIDGVPAFAVAESGAIGYLPQRPQILEGTVGENIARFRAASAEEVVAAARRAGLHATIGRLPRGYATVVGPEAPVMSGGERQRLALARALFGAPRLLVLDEPDASLDHAGEAMLVEAIEAARREGVAILAVTHRRRLLALADRVVRMEDGRCASGTEASARPRGEKEEVS